MDRGADEGDFLDLCEKYVELAEDRRRLAALIGAADGGIDEKRADEIDDIDARQRILMWRIICSGEPVEASPAAGPSDNSAQGRETGGAARGRFASERLLSTWRWTNSARR